MSFNKRWVLLLAAAAGAVAGAAFTSKVRQGTRRATRDAEHATQVKSWENEGGNLAPVPSAGVLP